MLIVCPACGARYEAPNSAIPAAGRIVRCSACRAEWRARPEPGRTEPVRTEADAPKPVAAPASAPQTADAPAVQPDVATAATAGTEPVVARPEAPAQPAGPVASRGAVPLTAAHPPGTTDAPQAAARPAPAAEIVTREIRTQPRSVSETTSEIGTAQRLATAIDEEPAPRGGTGFLAGFATVAILALAATAAYLKADAIVAMAPGLDGAMARYVALVDAGREALAGFVAGLRS
jgi:predicted Zn finger-like uncharacterized protein